MPGVTVEAASPALIEKVRSVVTDGQGQYKIVDLRPGVYSITFTLPGFNTVKREAVELPTNFTATINADLRVGALEETVTVSGLSPVVDVQNAVQQTVLTRQVLDAVPTGPQHPDARRAAVRRAPRAARRRRHVGHAEPRSDGARIRWPRHHVPGRRHDAERHRGRRQRAELLQRGDVRGDQLPDQRDQRRGVGRRRARQHDSEGRRQRLQGHDVPLRRQPEPAEQQQRRRPREGAGRARQPQQGVGLQRLRGRADPQGQALVLRVLSRLGRLSVHRQQLLQERRPDDRRRQHPERRRAPDHAAGGEEQGVGLSRSHPQIPRPRELRAGRLRDRRRGDRHPRAEAVLHDRGEVDEHGQQQAAGRGRARDQQRELHAGAAARVGRRDPATRHDPADRVRAPTTAGCTTASRCGAPSSARRRT